MFVYSVLLCVFVCLCVLIFDVRVCVDRMPSRSSNSMHGSDHLVNVSVKLV